MENITNSTPLRRRGTRGALIAGGVLTTLGTGYTIGTQVNAQQGATGTPTVSTPVVNTPATRDAALMQDAFGSVAKAAEPAVVTITTGQKITTASTNRRSPFPRQRPFGNGGGNEQFGGGNGNGNGADPFEEFLKRFKDFGLTPNSAQQEKMRDLWKEMQYRQTGLGSGMIYRQDGLILTNAHVVRGADTVTVKLNDGREFPKAKVLGIDERTDVAVVKIDAANLPIVKFSDSNNVKVGDWAIAVGNPFGLEHTVTVGIISAKAREMPDFNRRNPGEYLQTDASINPGNSGGPLLDIYGRVIGVNNAIYSESGGNIGIGFAIPINTARDIADQLVKGGKIRRGYLGVSIDTLTEEDAKGMGLPAGTKGVRIAEVSPDTPGGRAGLEVGDVVLSFNGQTVTKSTELQRAVQAAPVNSTAELNVLRGNKTVTLKAKLDELKDEAIKDDANTPEEEAPVNPKAGGTAMKDLGVSVKPLTPALAKQLGTDLKSGVVITDVTEGSAAANSGLQDGDIIVRVGINPVNNAAELQTAVSGLLANQAGEDKKVTLYVNTTDQTGKRRNVFVTLTVSK